LLDTLKVDEATCLRIYVSGPSMKHFTGKKGVNVFHQNIRGLFHNIINLLTVFEQGENFDMYTLPETHIVNNSELDNDELYKIPGDHFVKKNRQKGKGGGVAVYVSEILLNWKRRADLEPESIRIEVIPLKAKPFLVCCIHRPPGSSLYKVKNFKTLFENMLSAINDIKIEAIVTGDMNINYLKRADHKDLKDIIDIAGFKQIIQCPTRVNETSSTLIDIILTNNEHKISNGNGNGKLPRQYLSTKAGRQHHLTITDQYLYYQYYQRY